MPKGVGSLGPVMLRPWQRHLIHGLYEPGIRQALWSLPRGNGKSFLAACLALFGLFADQEEGARVLCVAGSERQSKLIYDTCRRMVELSEELSGLTQVHANRLVVPATDSVLTTMPARMGALQGADPSFCVIDELAIVADPTYESMSLSMGKRPNSLLLSISTSPMEVDSAMHRLREIGVAGDDPTFMFKEWAAPAGADHRNEDVWEVCNPALHDFLSVDALRSDLRKVREASFRRWRLNETVTDEGAWLPYGVLESLAAPGPVPFGTPITIGFDGSVSGDSTVLVGATVETEPYVFVLAAWEAPAGPAGEGWSVPRAEVSDAVRAAYSRFNVVELAADPPYWRGEIQEWAQLYPNVVEFPSHVPARMTPATDLVYSLITEKKLRHDGSEVLLRHCRNAVVRQTAAGDVVAKDHRTSPRRVDATIAMILAVSRAVWHANQPTKRRRVLAFG